MDMVDPDSLLYAVQNLSNDDGLADGYNTFTGIPIAQSARTTPAPPQPSMFPQTPPAQTPADVRLNRELTTFLTWGCWNFGAAVSIDERPASKQLGYWQAKFPKGWGKVLPAAARRVFFVMVELGPGHLSEASIDNAILMEVEHFVSTTGSCPKGCKR